MSTRQTRQDFPAVTLDELRALDTCTISNAIERLRVRLRNEGFTDRSVRCLTPGCPAMVGYAVTGRIMASAAPAAGHWYYHRMDFWQHLLTISEPRIIVIEDVDDNPGVGATFGRVQAYIAQALGCVGYVTNGVVRDLPGVQLTSLSIFAAGTVVSHAYAHLVDFGEPVKVGGLGVKPGDLLHGDCHGLLSIPASVASRVPAVAAKILAEERELIKLCESPDFSLNQLCSLLEKNRDDGQASS